MTKWTHVPSGKGLGVLCKDRAVSLLQLNPHELILEFEEKDFQGS